jgi:hypothetical protein
MKAPNLLTLDSTTSLPERDNTSPLLHNIRVFLNDIILPTFQYFFHWHNPSDRTMALMSTQLLIEMSTRRISCGQIRPVSKDDNLTTILCHLSWNLGTLTSGNPLGNYRPVKGLLHLLLFNIILPSTPKSLSGVPSIKFTKKFCLYYFPPTLPPYILQFPPPGFNYSNKSWRAELSVLR